MTEDIRTLAFQAIFTKEKETKNTVRYQSPKPEITTVYIHKSLASKVGDRFEMSIRKADS